MNFFDTLMDFFESLANRLNVSDNSGLYVIILVALVLWLVISLIMINVLSAKKKRLRCKNAEQASALSAIYESTRDMIVCKDKFGRYTDCNRAFEEFAGASAAKIKGKLPSEIEGLSGRMSTEIATVDRKAMSEGATLKIRKSLKFPDGSERFYESTRTPLIQKKGEVTGVLCIFRDLTELNEATKKLEVASNEVLNVRKIDFREVALKQIAAMGAALSNSDLPLYATYVKEIKVAAAGIGADELSELAHDLEETANRPNQEGADFVKTNHTELISSLSALLVELDKGTENA